jgi:hypothetical protein
LDQIDVLDCYPCDYNLGHKTKIGCTRPLYLINGLSILSTFHTKHDYNLSNLLKVYHWSSWLTLVTMIFILILLTSYYNTIWKSFWSFIDPLLGSGDSNSLKCFSFALYLLALIPFLEIIRNELLASLVAVKEIKSETIDDLLDPKITVYMFQKPQFWKKESEKIDDIQLRVKLQALFTKIGKSSGINDWLNLMQDTHKLKSVGRNYAFFSNEYKIRHVQVS